MMMMRWKLLVMTCVMSITFIPGDALTPEEAVTSIKNNNNLYNVNEAIRANASAFITYLVSVEDEMTLLMLAARYGRTSVVEQLIESGAAVDDQDIDGETALIKVLKYLAYLSIDNVNSIVDSLLDAGASVSLPDAPQWSPLHYGAYRGKSHIISSILSKNPDVNRGDNQERTPLILAAEEGFPVLELLIKAGADVNHIDYLGDTALLKNIRKTSSSNADQRGTLCDVLLTANASVELPNAPAWGPLHHAANLGASYIIKSLIKAKADVHRVDSKGQTALLVAAEKAQPVLDLLLEAGADVNHLDHNDDTALLKNIKAYSWYHVDKYNVNHDVLMQANANTELPGQPKWGPLHWASFKDASHILQSLISANAEIDRIDSEWRTPLLVAAEETSSVLEDLVEGGADVNHLTYEGETALTKLIMQSSSSDFDERNRLVDVLLQANANVTLPESPAWDPLHWAANNGFTYIIQSLTSSGADVNRIDSKGRTPLIVASERGLSVLQSLIDAGANVDIMDDDEDTALTKSIRTYYSNHPDRLKNVGVLLLANASVDLPPSPSWDPLHWAADRNSYYILNALVSANADVNREDSEGRTALLVAAEKGYSILEPLIDGGTDVNHMNHDGETALILACKNWNGVGHEAVVDALLDVGADINLRTFSKYSALHWAVYRRSPYLTRRLIDGGASLSLTDNEGYTALLVAADLSSQRLPFVSLLLTASSDVNALSFYDGTVLHLLTLKSDEETLSYVMQFCPNLSLRNSAGKTALELATSRNDQTIMDILSAESEDHICPFEMEAYYEGDIRCDGRQAYTCTDSCIWTEVAPELGNCSCEIVCPGLYNLVCGSDGITYDSECDLQNAACTDPSIVKVNEGTCEPTTTPNECDMQCPEDYNPVCGSDGITYSSGCHLAMAACTDPSIELVKEGPCADTTTPIECEMVCPDIYKPVCGSDGITYDSECDLQNAACADPSIVQVKEGTCETTTTPNECDMQCPEDYNPVCGSDGITYSSGCHLAIAACTDPSIELVKEGPCDPVSTTTLHVCEKFCPEIYNPVCGSDGKTYDSECVLQNAACMDPSIVQVKEGPCDLCDMDCFSTYQPVCGSDGATYSNKCELQKAACNNPAIVMVKDGPCDTPCDVVCPGSYEPVCGSNGITFSNVCELQKVATCNNELTLVMEHGGMCSQPENSKSKVINININIY